MTTATHISHVSVPGKVMLSGEYAVLSGERSLAVTVDRALSVDFEWSMNGVEPEQVLLESNLWDGPRVLTATDAEPFSAAVRHGIEKSGQRPARIAIKSDLDVRYGLGSSSALRLGVSLGFRARGHDPDTARTLAEKDAYTLQFAHQALASGYDVLTQSRGGLVVYEPGSPWPGTIETYDIPDAWHSRVRILGGGKGAPTGPVMQHTLAWLREMGLEEALSATSRRLTDHLLATMVDPAAWIDVYRSCGAHRRFFANAPHDPRTLLADCESLPGADRTWSLKTTGAGGEDALVLFGAAPDIKPVLEKLACHGWEVLPLQLANAGTHWTEAPCL